MASPRIIGGTARGRRLFSVPGDSTRPVTDRAKEALFNILAADVQDASFLDLFGGTGSVGLEAMSRGAVFARLIDINVQAIDTIKKNVALCGFEGKVDVLRADTLAILRRPVDRDFDYIYIAPPQYKGLWIKTLQLVDQNPGWLAEYGWVIVQIDPRESEEVALENLEPFDERKYGNTLLVFYQHKDIASE